MVLEHVQGEHLVQAGDQEGHHGHEDEDDDEEEDAPEELLDDVAELEHGMCPWYGVVDATLVRY